MDLEPALERRARTGSARRATFPEPGADEPGHDRRLMAGSAYGGGQLPGDTLPGWLRRRLQ
jgi:hypothetical protein